MTSKREGPASADNGCRPCGGASEGAHRIASPEQNQRTLALEIFAARCAVRAYLVCELEIDLHDAVDGLQHSAECQGLIDQIGQDAVQAVMSAAFFAAIWDADHA